MRAAGIVVEYNPFHNGHLYHINETKRLAEADVIIAVMSGAFLQRGEPAFLNKWTRTKMALLNGADIVIELPYAFATQKAETFASGAVQLLYHMNCTSFCFGSESGRAEAFTETAERLAEKQPLLDSFVSGFMKEGMSYPAAQKRAREKVFSADLPIDLSQPNNILGFQYIIANKELGFPMKPLTVLRKGAGYHDLEAAGSIASATALRKILLGGKNADSFVPDNVRAFFAGQPFHSWELYWPLLRYRLMTIHADELAAIYEVEEGIGPRLKERALSSNSFESFMQEVKTKRYTWTRLQRMLTHVLTNTTKAEIALAARISSIRLLGMTQNGRAYLRHVKPHAELPIISRTASFTEQLALDIKASRVYASAPSLSSSYQAELLQLEFSAPPLLL